MGALSIQHWIMVLLVVLLLFGASRLGDVGKGLGEGIRNFKKGLGGNDEPPPVDSKRVENADAEAGDSSSSQNGSAPERPPDGRVG